MRKMILVLILAVLLPYFISLFLPTADTALASDVCKLPIASSVFVPAGPAGPDGIAMAQHMITVLPTEIDVITAYDNYNAEKRKANIESFSRSSGEDWSDIGLGLWPCIAHGIHPESVFFHKNDCE